MDTVSRCSPFTPSNAVLLTWLLFSGLALGCGASQTDTSSMNGAGTTNSAIGGTPGQANAGAGGTVASGGNNPSGTPSTVGQGNGGDANNTTAGAGGAGGSGGSTGTAGANAGGTAGAAGSATQGPVASTGCGMSDPVTGDRQITIENNEAHFLVSIPDGYDPMAPYPLGFGFHGRNRTGPNCHDGDCAGFQEVMHDEAILVYMTSLGGTGWEGETERELNVTFFETVLAQLKAEYCVDESRVFVAGTSSGANFTNVLGCRFADQLLAVAPVAGGLPESENCAGSVAALVIHGVDDYHVPFADGQVARDFYVMQNGCMATTDVSIPDLHASVVAERESHQCANFQGCPTGLPVTWCEHSEGGYDGSTHGWPLFGGQAIWDFVSALP